MVPPRKVLGSAQEVGVAAIESFLHIEVLDPVDEHPEPRLQIFSLDQKYGSEALNVTLSPLWNALIWGPYSAVSGPPQA